MVEYNGIEMRIWCFIHISLLLHFQPSKMELIRYPNAHAKVKKWILTVQFPRNCFEIGIILNDFWSASIWDTQILVSFSWTEIPKKYRNSTYAYSKWLNSKPKPRSLNQDDVGRIFSNPEPSLVDGLTRASGLDQTVLLLDLVHLHRVISW